MVGQSDLTVRQFERNEVVLEGEFEVAEAHRGQVTFSGRDAAVIDARTLRITVSDVGAGGIGFQSPMYLPRQLRGIVRIFDPTRHGEDSDEHAVHCIAFEHLVRIRRCDLTSRLPSYFVGSAFENADERFDESLASLMDRISTSMQDRMIEQHSQRGFGPDRGGDRV